MKTPSKNFRLLITAIALGSGQNVWAKAAQHPTVQWTSLETATVLSSTEDAACEAPTVSIENGKLLLSSATSGAVFHYSVVPVVENAPNGEVSVTGIKIEAYATADGYAPSAPISREIPWADVKGAPGDVNHDGNVTVVDIVSIIERLKI